MMPVKSLCERVCDMASGVAGFIRTERKSFSAERVERKGHNDLVSYVDKTAERMLVEQLGALLPGSGFIAEEGSVARSDAEYQWIVDPLDGTTNFVHGIPCYCISIALTRAGQAIAGVVYEINLDECFYAWEGGGAWLNGRSIRVSPTSTLANSLVATGFPYTDYARMKPYMEVFDHCMRHSHGLRRLGSAAVDLAYVACGRFDSFYEYGLNAWDVAAGAFLVREAGGTVTNFSGGDEFIGAREILATNGGTHGELLQVIREKFGHS
jgi:myo-inositol-1(or 4)-monophosphatase